MVEVVIMIHKGGLLLADLKIKAYSIWETLMYRNKVKKANLITL